MNASRRSAAVLESASNITGIDECRNLLGVLSAYAIFALSADGRIAKWNSGAKTLFGYSEQEVLGKPYSLLFTAEDIAAGRPEAELLAALHLGSESFDGWHLRNDGSRFWCTDTVQPIRDELGVVTGFTKIVSDSTDRYTSAERIRESEERLRTLIEDVTDHAILSIDLAGKIVLWNSGAEHVFGYNVADAVGKHFSLMYTPEAIAAGIPQREIEEATEFGHAVDEAWHVRRGGDLFYASGQMTRLRPGIDGESRGFVKIAHDITARNTTDEANKRRALYDDLTKLPNRAFFFDVLQRSLARAKRHGDFQFAVLFVDLDHFKIINDSRGHAIGDALLERVARLLERCVRPYDIVARLGGDEFAILLSELHDPAEATRVAQRIHAELALPIDLDGSEVYSTASIGIALGSSTYERSEHILRDSDLAMYAAKARGRSRHEWFEPSMRGNAVRRLDIQTGLRHAIARQEFLIEYQPIVSLPTGLVVGFEALVRWNHPVRGVLPPSEFIPEAEITGMIIQIDRSVLHEACRQIRAWQVQFGDDNLTVSVNLSSKHFVHENLLDEIHRALRQNDLSARSLKLEITETVLMENVEAAAATIAHLSEIGVALYIDDFGTGYSSLSYLTRLPLRVLKVDRSFVSQLSSDPRGVEIARTVVNLAHSLRLVSLAEGIETEEQLVKLRSLGCELGQGYWFSRPVSAAAAQHLIGRNLPLLAGGSKNGSASAATASPSS